MIMNILVMIHFQMLIDKNRVSIHKENNMNIGMRTCKYLNNEGSWIEIDPKDLKAEMYFMMFEPDNQPVRSNKYGDVVYEAATDSYWDNGVLTIQVVE